MFSAPSHVIKCKKYAILDRVNRNQKGCPKKLRNTAYISLIRSALEYIAALFDTHTKSNKDKIEKLQRRAARFVSNNFRRKASVSEMLHNLGWQSLDGRRHDQRVYSSFFYKIINGLASVETDRDILTPTDSRTRKNHIFKFKHFQRARSYRDKKSEKTDKIYAEYNGEKTNKLEN